MSNIEPAIITLPTVHLNGTGRAQLLCQNKDALIAVRKAITAVQAAAPHGRDYYTQDPVTSYTKAREEHAVRLRALEKIESELIEIYYSVKTKDGE